MAMRDLVSGGAACAVPGSSSSTSNPIGQLANTLFGGSSSSKTPPGARELPVTRTNPADPSFYPGNEATTLPGSEFDQQPQFHPHSDAQGRQFLDAFSRDQGGFDAAWNDSSRSQVPPPPYLQPREMPSNLSNFEQIYESGARSQIQPTLDGPPQRVLSNFLHSFVGSSHAGVPFRPVQLPVLGLSEGDKQCIRDRSSIMARHFFADKGEEFINAQVNALLHSLEIDNDLRAKGYMPAGMHEMEKYWNDSQGNLGAGVPQAGDGWAGEFNQQMVLRGNPESWAHSFAQEHGPNGWASEFAQQQSQMIPMGQMQGANNFAAMEQTRMLAHTLAQNNDPKFQNSKFFQFVSKMSRGELIIDDNQVKPVGASTSGDWANEFQQKYNAGSNSWADQFATEHARGPDTWASEFQHSRGADSWASEFQHSRGADSWATQFANEQGQRGADDEWVNEFSKLHVQDWADEFGKQVAEGALETDSSEWATAYDE